MSFDRYSHDSRSRTYAIPEQSHSQPPAHLNQAQQYYSREVPRYDPSLSRLSPPQILGHSHTEGSSGTTFSVPVADISHDPRTYKFVFGQRKVGAFLERSRSSDTSSVLVAQVPKFADTKWWSNKVPVYLLVTDSQTDENIHSVQICEFTYVESPTPSPLKRTRDELATAASRHGSPVKRSSSQPGQQGPAPYYNPLPAPTYQAQYSQPATYQTTPQYEPQAVNRDISMPVQYPLSSSVSSFELPRVSSSGRDPQQNRFIPSPLSIPDQLQNRYIAEPQDHYSARAGNSDFMESSISSRRHGRRSPATTPTYYQSSISSSPATWKSPYHTASGLVYASSPPPLSSASKTEIPYESDPLPEDSFDPHAPTLQRTSTLSSGQSSVGAPAATPTSTQAGWLPSSKAKLEVLGNLDDMSRNWSAEEFSMRRRLVQFWRKQEGNVVKINFRPVDVGATRPPHAIIISCIYWEERQECFFTSVDAIFLLENLVGNKFAVEEKNRIRRNLEGFRPLTVSKGKSDSENFFKLIMGFPAPKPRNIEKDVKAFPWRILTSALRKIIGKYSASYEGLTERTGTENAATDGNSTPVPTSADMPPPSLRRHTTVESNNSTDTVPLPQQRMQMQPGQLSDIKESQDHTLPRIAADRAEPSTNRQRASSPRLSGGLQIKVPQLADNLPVLDGAVPASNDFERRPSGINGFPMSGISNVDFSEFFQQSPGGQAASGSGWPSLSSLFPPPSAGFGIDHPPPRRD